MAFRLIAGDIVKVTPVIQLVGQVALSGWHMICTGIGGLGGTDFDVAAFYDNLHTQIKDLLQNVAQYRGVMVQKIFPLPVEPRTFSNTNAGVGTAGIVGLPAQVSGIIHITGEIAGRGGRGRFYMPFPAVNDNAQGVADLAHPTSMGVGNYVSRLSNIVNNFMTVIVAGTPPDTATLEPALYNRKTHATQRFIAKIIEVEWATTRRRGAFGRPNTPPF